MRSSEPSLDIQSEIERIIALAAAPVASSAELTANLRAVYAAVIGFDLGRYRAGNVAEAAPRLMKAAFDARMRLRNGIAGWHQAGLLNAEAVAALRDVFRVSRYGIDMLGETLSGHRKLGSGEKTRRAFTGTGYNTFVNPRFDTGHNLPFRSGDVLLMRGNAHNSAAIARIGDVDTQFSHVAVVHVGADGRHSVVESLIEDGAVISTLEHSLDHGVGRMVLYRHHDEALAARAADIVHARVKASLDGRARHIPYDFSMRLDGKTGKLFCSKLVRLAYEEASSGKLALPAFKTQLGNRNRDFFRRIGVRATETFAPGDIDVDPAFDLVAEWQDYRATSRLRIKDMMMDKLFEWMESHGYKFDETFVIRLISIFGRLSSHLSNDAKELLADVIPKVPSNMPRRAIAAVAMLQQTGEELMGPLSALEEDHIRRTGLPLPPALVGEHLERLRVASGGSRIGYLEAR